MKEGLSLSGSSTRATKPSTEESRKHRDKSNLMNVIINSYILGKETSNNSVLESIFRVAAGPVPHARTSPWKRMHRYLPIWTNSFAR
jgi:hypothetical protein